MEENYKDKLNEETYSEDDVYSDSPYMSIDRYLNEDGVIDVKVYTDNIVAGNEKIGTALIEDASITTAKIADASITSAKIADASIDTAKIKTGAITTALIDTGAVGTAQIADGSITDAKIVSLTANKITSGTIDTSQVTVQGTNGKLRISDNRLQVFDNQRTPVERVSLGDVNGDGTVYGLKVRSADGKTILYDHNGVYSAGITDGAITNPKISDGAVDNRVIAANAITADKIVAGTITGDKIASKTITANNIAANTITAGSAIIADGAITSAKIADASITSAKIANLAVDTAKIADASITDAKIANISADKITTGTLNADIVNITGKLTSVSIDVSTDVKIGNTLYIGDPYDLSTQKAIQFSTAAEISTNHDGLDFQANGLTLRSVGSEGDVNIFAGRDVFISAQGVIQFDGEVEFLGSVTGLSTNQSGSHSHTASIWSSGEHNHGGSTGSNGSHNHGLISGHQIRMRNPSTGAEYWATYYAAPDHSHSIMTSGEHTHSIKINYAGEHSHNFQRR